MGFRSLSSANLEAGRPGAPMTVMVRQIDCLDAAKNGYLLVGVTTCGPVDSQLKLDLTDTSSIHNDSFSSHFI